ncbi:MAG: hypothetical protein KAW56_01550 [Candidatus Marinimicrobia bacterium]|nr:hypothetical protein [Candidatus Neomarinimicrobiota bacterium]
MFKLIECKKRLKIIRNLVWYCVCYLQGYVDINMNCGFECPVEIGFNSGTNGTKPLGMKEN